MAESGVALRQLGATPLKIAPVALGCWPMAGMTSLDAAPADSLATLEACFELGINHLDTAFCYGAAGESERLIAQAIRGRRAQVVLATKGGIAWDSARMQVVDGRPATLARQCRESLQRLETSYADLYYLHAPDPRTPIAESAGAVRDLISQGLVRYAGLSNATVDELEQFHRVCPLAAYQPPYNMLQRGIERDTLPWCREHQVGVLVYWPLMKGLLTGKFSRQHVFRPEDGRAKYPMFQGDEWQKNQDFLDELRSLAQDLGKTVAQIVIRWTIDQPGITAALCGALRPGQVRDNAGALGWTLDAAARDRIDRALARRGTAITRAAVETKQPVRP